MPTTKNSTKVTAPKAIPARALKPLTEALQGLANAERNVSTYHLKVGRAVKAAMANGRTAKDINAALPEALRRSGTFYTHVKAAATALKDAKVTDDEAVGPRGDTDNSGGVGSVLAFGQAVAKVYRDGGNIPAFVDAWRHGVNPTKDDSPTVGMQVYRDDAKWIRERKGEGIEDADIIRMALKAYRQTLKD